MEYTEKAIDDLIPYINNSRTHSPEQVNQLAASIKEHKIYLLNLLRLWYHIHILFIRGVICLNLKKYLDMKIMK